MKTTSKKLLSIILAILMIATTIPTFVITALAEANPTVLNITLDLDTSVELGTQPAGFKISDAYLSDYSDNCEDFGYEGLPYFFLANNQCYGTTGEGAPKGTAIYPDEKGNQWCWMNGPYTEGNRYGNMIFVSDSDLETKPDKFNVNGVLYNVLDSNGWYYCLLDLGVADSTGKLSGGDFVCKHTYGTKGDSRYTCQSCGEIDKEKQAEALLADAKATKYNNSTKLNAAFKVVASKTSKNTTVKWGKVKDADGYKVYAGYCGKNDPKLIKTIKGCNTTKLSFTKLDGKNVDMTKNIKAYVVAYKNIDGKQVEIGKSIIGHSVGYKNKTYTNAKAVNVNNSNLTINANKTAEIKATVVLNNSNKKAITDSHCASLRYRSSDKAVATVDKNGKITAKSAGTCTIYVFAKNGVSTKVTVTVK